MENAVLDTKKLSHLLKVQKDKLTVTFTGRSNHSQDVGAIQSNMALKSNDLISYFEITVIDGGLRSCVAIGLSDANFSLNRQPGWEANSYGYHGEDGKKYHDSPQQGEAFASKFSTNDTIGCGLHATSRDVFFTKNGKHLGTAFQVESGAYYPTIGLHSPGEVVTVNFGARAFAFDLRTLIAEEREKLKREMSACHVGISAMTDLVRDYLLHFGYEKAVKSFDRSCCRTENESVYLASSLSARKELRQLILAGSIEQAILAATKLVPTLLTSSPQVAMYLHSQQFIELIRGGNTDEAVAFAEVSLAPFLASASSEPASDDGCSFIESVLGLLAYDDPTESPLAHLLLPEQREHVADVLNTAVLESTWNCRSESVLETLVRQTTAVDEELRVQQGGSGQVFSLSSV